MLKCQPGLDEWTSDQRTDLSCCLRPRDTTPDHSPPPLPTQNRFSSLLSNVVGPQTGLEKYEKAKKDAEIAEEKYKREVVILDRLR